MPAYPLRRMCIFESTAEAYLQLEGGFGTAGGAWHSSKQAEELAAAPRHWVIHAGLYMTSVDLETTNSPHDWDPVQFLEANSPAAMAEASQFPKPKTGILQ